MFTKKPDNYVDWVESLRSNKVRDKFLLFTQIIVSFSLPLLIMVLWARADTTTDTGSLVKIAVAVNETAGPANGISSTGDVVAKAYEFVVSIYVVGGEADEKSQFEASGSGVVVSADGYIVTNKHVIEQATTIYVRFNGETESAIASLVGVSQDSDLAVLKVERTGLVSGVFAKNNTVSVGDPVIAVGYSIALDGLPSVSKGIVSGVDRTLDSGYGILNEMVQTDAALSSGNSGGPLLDEEGNIVGVNTLVLDGGASEYISNIGFAISSDKVVASVQALTRSTVANVNKPKPGFLGVSVQERPQGSLGVIVERIESGSGAQVAGIIIGDIILSVDDKPVYSVVGIMGILKDLEEGDGATIGILRKNTPIALEVVLGAKVKE